MLLFLIFQVNFIIPAWVYNMYFFIENGDEDDAVPEDEPLIIINDDDDEEHDGDDDGAPTLERSTTPTTASVLSVLLKNLRQVICEGRSIFLVTIMQHDQ